MGNKKSDYNVEREVTGTRPPGATRPNLPQSRIVTAEPAQRMGNPGEAPTAIVTGPSTMWFNTTAEFDRWYRRLHPMRFSIARRLDRIEREQQREREINTIRNLTRERRDIFEQLSMLARQPERLVERNLQRQRDQDPLNQFNRRIRRRFEQAMDREADVLTEQMSRLRISGSPRPPPNPIVGPVEEVD